MIKTIRILCLVFSVLLLGSVVDHAVPANDKAVEIDEATRKLCNDIILNMYYDILEKKDDFPELEHFDESVMFENKEGIYTIVYEHQGEEDLGPRGTPYRFGITIDKTSDQTFSPVRGSFSFGFPGIGLKFSGYLQKHRLRTQYNIMPLIDKYGPQLVEHQQNYLPLRLYLRPLHDSYRVQEDIEFEVELKNVGKSNMVVKSLGSKTLFFLFNGQFWGTFQTEEKTGGTDIILNGGDSLTMSFKGESFQRPREFEILGRYNMSVKGVQPSAVLKIKVVEGDPINLPPYK